MANILGDSDVLALLDEMNDGATGADGSATSANGNDHRQTDNLTSRRPVANPDGTSPRRQEQRRLTAAAYHLCPPSNPHVEIIRHRCHEKFKSSFYDLFRHCAPQQSNGNNGSSAGGGGSGSNAGDDPASRRNERVKSAMRDVWESIPPHSVWERFQFSLKTLEAECVRDALLQSSQRGSGIGDDAATQPWCRRDGGNDGDDRWLRRLVSPTVHEIQSWIVKGKFTGTVWEPLLPVPSVISDENDDRHHPINQKYRRGALELLQGEVEFQFRRTFKQLSLGGVTGQQRGNKGKNGKGPPLSVDEIYASFKECEGASADTMDKPSKKQKKRKKRGNDVDVVKNDATNKEKYILRTIFESQPFARTIQKLLKRFFALAEERYSSHFLPELQKCSNRLNREEQSRLASVGGAEWGKKRKRKGGSGVGSSSLPKVSYDEGNDDGYNKGDGTDNRRQLCVTFAGISLRINERHKQKLYSLYQSTLFNLLADDEDSDTKDNRCNNYLQLFPQLLFTILLRYDALEGAGLQSAIPPTVFQFLHQRFGCDYECFASPFNCWAKDITNGDGNRSSKFGSAFGDTDAMFGSFGSFFGVDFVEMGGGCFQANPPFASKFIERMCHQMNHFLSATSNCTDEDGNEKTDLVPLMFIIFVPAWSESSGWKTLSSSEHMTKHVLLNKKNDVHYYAEGTQHRRNNSAAEGSGKGGSHRVASFDTSVFFFQNGMARKKWPLVDNDENMLKKAFAMVQVVAKKDEAAKQISQKRLRPHEVERAICPGTPNKGPTKGKKKKATNRRKVADGPTEKKKLIDGVSAEMSILASLGVLDKEKPHSPPVQEHVPQKKKKRFKRST